MDDIELIHGIGDLVRTGGFTQSKDHYGSVAQLILKTKVPEDSDLRVVMVPVVLNQVDADIYVNSGSGTLNDFKKKLLLQGLREVFNRSYGMPIRKRSSLFKYTFNQYLKSLD